MKLVNKEKCSHSHHDESKEPADKSGTVIQTDLKKINKEIKRLRKELNNPPPKPTDGVEYEAKDKIDVLEKTNEEGLEKAKRLALREQRSIAAQRAYEEAKFKQFKKIVNGERFFRLEHIKKLGIKYDIAIHLSAKNIGKTTELYRLIKETIDRGKKFIYGRVTPLELDTEIDKFREDAISPVILLKDKSRFFFYDKRKVQAITDKYPRFIPTCASLMRMGVEDVGKGMTFLGSNTLGGGNYVGYEMIFFDEIVSYTPKNYINKRILYNWGCAISTVLRDKHELTIIMMGNLQNNLSEVPILKYYGIDVGDNLRIIKRSLTDNSPPCTILYINSGSLYLSSLKNQASVAHHASLDDRLFMEHNKIINSSVKVLNSAVVSKMTPVCACAVEYIDEFYALELREYRVGFDDNDNYFALCVYPMTITTAIKPEIYTHDPVVSNMFSKVSYRRNMRPMYKMIYKLFINDVLYYDNMHSLEIGARCMEEVISRYLDATEPARLLR